MNERMTTSADEQGLRLSQSGARSADEQLLRHELRTPINQILGYASLLQHELRDLVPERPLDDLEKIKKAARKILDLVQSLDAPAMPSMVPPPSVGRRAPSGLFRLEGVSSSLARLAAESGGDRAHLLVVDDNEMNRDILSRCLTMHGYEVEVAADGRAALALIETGRFDAVLLDVMMPGMSGLEVLREVRKEHAVSDLPILMATARDHSDDIVEALHLGANDYVSKPLDFEVVLARLESQLALKRGKERIESLVDDLEIKNRFIQKTFGRYLSDEVVANLLETPEGLRLGGEKRQVSILMSDLRGFTALTESMPPEQVMQLLNTYLGAMTEIITRHGGTIDELIGDAILAVFGAPLQADDDACRAAACALEMQLEMNAVNAQNERDRLPTLEMGIALHTGAVVVGNIGSERRSKYGIVGSHVNLTARIESFTVGGQILISEATRALVGPEISIGRTLTVDAKGFKEPITVHDLVGLGAPYDLVLPARAAEHFPLRHPISVQLSRLSEKHIDADVVEGSIVALSMAGAVIRARPPPAPFVNLRLRFTGELGQRASADLYAKVLEAGETGDRCEVRFTSFAPPIVTLLREILLTSIA